MFAARITLSQRIVPRSRRSRLLAVSRAQRPRHAVALLVSIRKLQVCKLADHAGTLNRLFRAPAWRQNLSNMAARSEKKSAFFFLFSFLWVCVWSHGLLLSADLLLVTFLTSNDSAALQSYIASSSSSSSSLSGRQMAAVFCVYV